MTLSDHESKSVPVPELRNPAKERERRIEQWKRIGKIALLVLLAVALVTGVVVGVGYLYSGQ